MFHTNLTVNNEYFFKEDWPVKLCNDEELRFVAARTEFLNRISTSFSFDKLNLSFPKSLRQLYTHHTNKPITLNALYCKICT